MTSRLITSAAATTSFGIILVGAFVLALYRARLRAIVPAIGLTLVFLILAGLALAAVHALSVVPLALVLALAALTATWRLAREPAEPRVRPHPLALAGVLVFVVASVLAVRYAADSAASDAAGASSVAVWAYPSGDGLQVGVQQAAGQGTASLRVVVSQAGITARTWNDIRLSPGQSWEAPAFTLAGSGPVQVTVLRGGTVLASVSGVRYAG